MGDVKFYVDYDEETTVVDKIKAYIEEHSTYEHENITIGCWDAWDAPPAGIIDYMVENKAKFPHLKKVFLGDMESEECEISWICHTDSAPLVNALNLEELIIKGANGLRLQNMKSHTLKKLTIISGGTANDVLADIMAAQMPNLVHLELYLGIEDYGCEAAIADLAPFMLRSNFPNVKYLGLKNSEIQDEICARILASDILAGLEVLDLSLGNLSNKSAELILTNVNKLSQLKKLDLSHNYISNELIQQLHAALRNYHVELDTDRGNVNINYDWRNRRRYPYITE